MAGTASPRCQTRGDPLFALPGSFGSLKRFPPTASDERERARRRRPVARRPSRIAGLLLSGPPARVSGGLATPGAERVGELVGCRATPGALCLLRVGPQWGRSRRGLPPRQRRAAVGWSGPDAEPQTVLALAARTAEPARPFEEDAASGPELILGVAGDGSAAAGAVVALRHFLLLGSARTNPLHHHGVDSGLPRSEDNGGSAGGPPTIESPPSRRLYPPGCSRPLSSTQGEWVSEPRLFLGWSSAASRAGARETRHLEPESACQVADPPAGRFRLP